jgi:phosphatidylethanolamine-binding protein (PEBP) family uncharacterized protein
MSTATNAESRVDADLIKNLMAAHVETLTLGAKGAAADSNATSPSMDAWEEAKGNPAITIKDIPKGTKSIALIADGNDASNGVFDHWIIWNILPAEIMSNSAPGIVGKKSSVTSKCNVYALDTLLDVRAGADRKTVEEAMGKHILGIRQMKSNHQKFKTKSRASV